MGCCEHVECDPFASSLALRLTGRQLSSPWSSSVKAAWSVRSPSHSYLGLEKEKVVSLPRTFNAPQLT